MVPNGMKKTAGHLLSGLHLGPNRSDFILIVIAAISLDA
jgi:hypothetical protein